MPIRNSSALSWKPRSLSDSLDGTTAPDGAMQSLVNLIPDDSTDRVFSCRPAAIEHITFEDFSAPGFISGYAQIGDIAYGMIASSRFAGHDEPFAYNVRTGALLTVSGMTSANTPLSPPSTGDWTPPKLSQVGSRVIVTHPGFTLSDLVRFGWFDVSGLMIAVEGNTISGNRYIYGNPDLFGVQPGNTVTGTGIPANTVVANTHPYYIGLDFVGDTHSSTLIDGIADTTDLFPNLQIAGSGIPPGTRIIARTAVSITISQATTSTVANLVIQVVGNRIMGSFDTLASTHSNTTVDAFNIVGASGEPLGLAVGQGVSGEGILPGTTVVSVGPGNTITISVAATSTVTSMHLTVEGATIVLSANATATNNSLGFTIAGGTRTAPLWGAGNTDNFPLPSVPVGVARFNDRAWFACGLDGILFSDPNVSCRISNAFGLQVLTTNDGLAVTAIAPLMLSSPLVTTGIVGAIVAFEGQTKMQQITGDIALGTLSMNAMNVATGTLAPNSICQSEYGLFFISPHGLRLINLEAKVSAPIGDHGLGVAVPFIDAAVPSRIAASANADSLRVSVGEVEYWYNLTRQAWSGPHNFPASLIQPWDASFIMAPLGILRSLWLSDVTQSAASVYVENGVQMMFEMETVLLPDSGGMAMNAMVEANLACSMPPTERIAVRVFDEDGTILDTIQVGPSMIGITPRLRQRPMYWTEPVVFKQASIRMYGFSNADTRIGDLYMRWEVLGYSITAPFVNYLYDDSTPPRLLTDDHGEPLVSG